MADRYTSFMDRFDGGGKGQSGPRFEGGGILSAAANAVARPAGSRERGDPDMRTGLGGFARDMVDGGGFNRSGPTFQGGPFGGLFGALLNSGGVRPMGYQERLGSVRPQMRPQMPTLPAYMQPPAPAPAAPMYTPHSAMEMPFQRQPVVTPQVNSYPLDDPFGEMMMRLHTQGIPSATQGIPSATQTPLAPPAGPMSMEQWVATTFSDGLPASATPEALTDSYQIYLNDVEQLGPRYPIVVETPASERPVLAQSVAQQTPSNYQEFVDSNRTGGVLTPVRPEQMNIMPGLYARSPALMRARVQGRYGAPTYTYNGPR